MNEYTVTVYVDVRARTVEEAEDIVREAIVIDDRTILDVNITNVVEITE